jgi:hypothetical protein
MDKFDLDTKALQRAENVIRTVLANGAGTDVSSILPLLGYSNAEDALTAADLFAAEAARISSKARTDAVVKAKAAVKDLPPTALVAFDRKVKRSASAGE